MRTHLVLISILALVLGTDFSAAQAAPPVAVVAPAEGRLVLPRPKTGRAQPLVVVVAGNAGAETTDFIIPYGVLKASGLAEVRSLSTQPGPVELHMALRIQADQTIAQFDAAEPAGADIVIVPAQMVPKDPVLTAWVAAQARRGAVIVSICEGARVLAAAGLLDGRRATTHWAAIKKLEKAYPATTWVRDRRYVQDGPIISTTGVTASIPASLALVEALGGHAAAAGLAARLGVSDWSPAHQTDDFQITRSDYLYGIVALLAFWRHETVEAPIADGTDEIGLALWADSWQRSYRTKVLSTRPGLTPVRSLNGLTLLPDAEPKAGRYRLPISPRPSASQLDAALAAMDVRYGQDSVRLAWLGLEYDRPK
ncbi:putative intracellular protease/amidase [Caulobacter ginsengisoli]|uniref:Intracellular protease/amidase n=1 Tax=Caulobacter ginsengisoli TaxID=400775 RepID=A0ABU0ISR3_9CAUL|nr:DJ-1/PfpI family protein [Caulobacter ginsengisoli]MDQ0465035.1 putative intracellular protease/amidase [Caulobacter ginsengisoli]